MDGDRATISVGFAIDATGSFDTLSQLDRGIDSTADNAVKELARVEKASQGFLNLGGAIAEVKALRNETTGAAQAITPAFARIELSNEALIKRLERQNDAFGTSREQLRGMKVEAAALAAEQQGLSEQAQRLRAAEQALYDQEFAAARRAAQEAEAVAEAKAVAAQQAVVAAEQEAKAIREAAFAYQMFEARVREGSALLREQQAAAAALAAEREATAVREAAFAHQMFEARVRQGAAAMREEEAAATRDANEIARLREMLDPAAAAYNRLAIEIENARRVMIAAGADAEELARIELLLTQRSNGLHVSTGQLKAGQQQLMYNLNDAATMWAMQAPPMQIFVSQAGQTIQAIQLMTSETKGFLGFLGGPWGMALTTAAVVLVPFVASLWEGTDAAKAQEEALKRQKDAVEELDRITGRGNQTLQERVRLTADASAKLLEQEKNTLALTKAELQRMISMASGPKINGPRGEGLNAGQSLVTDLAKGQLEQLRKSLAETEKQISVNEQRVRAGSRFALDQRVTALTDKNAAATQHFQDELILLQRAYDKGAVSEAEYIRKQVDLVHARDAVLNADKNARSALRDHNKEVRDATREQRELDAAYASTIRSLDPLADATNTYRLELEKLDKLENAGRLGHFEANDLRDTALAKLDTSKIEQIAKNYSAGFTQAIEAPIKASQPLIDLMQDLDGALGKIPPSLEEISFSARLAADSMADAFGRVGGSIGDAANILTQYGLEQKRIDEEAKLRGADLAALRRQSSDLQLDTMVRLTSTAKGFFRENSTGYRAMETAERALAVVQLARTAQSVAAGAAQMFASLGPFAFPAVAAMLGVMASLGFNSSGSANAGDFKKGNDGSGTIFGDASTKSDSLERAIASLKEVDTVTSVYAREMASSLRSIDSQIGNLAAVVVRSGNISADDAVSQGFKKDTLGKTLSSAFDPLGIGSKIPIVGGILGGISGLVGSLFGTKTKVIGSGLFGGSQSIGDIMSGGLDLQTYSDVEKTKKFLGVSTSKKLSTIFGAAADQAITDQFTLILRSFNDAIVASAGPLGVSTSEIATRVSSFVFDLGKIDLKGLTGDEIQDKLTAVFGAAADEMARAGFPEIDRFQKVGEGAFETLTRVATTVETVTTTLNNLGAGALALGIDAKMSLADQFDSVSAFADAADSYFTTYFSKSEQAATRTAQFTTLFGSLGLAMPSSIAGFRQLVEAQNLMTESGRDTYATLLQIAPAFAELQTSLLGAKSAADILAERQDLERQLLEAQGNTAAIRELDLAKLDASNRTLQEQIWAVQDAKAAADAAKELRDAWSSVGDSIMDEIKRIRGLTTGTTGGSFASIFGQFNAASTAARLGDQDAAKSLPGLSQALLTAAANAATSSQELKRVQAQTAASLQQTYDVIAAMTRTGGNAAALSVAAAQASSATAEATDSMLIELRNLRTEVAQLRTENNSGHAATASNTGRVAKKLDDVTAASGGDAVSVAA